jgi:hypothetical protein
MSGSIGKLAEQILAETKAGALTKLAEVEAFDLAEIDAQVQTELGKSMLKLSSALRGKASNDVTMDDLKMFLGSLR